MSDAQTLFREGVQALRQRGDVNEGRRLLTESLRLNPDNEMAWLWLAQTVSDPARRMQCINHALRINPYNERALALKAKIDQPAHPAPVDSVPVYAPDPAPQPAARAAAPPAPSMEEKRMIQAMFKKADQLLKDGDTEAAIEQWVRVLEIEVDNEIAMRNAVGHLSRLRYMDDARELVWRAIDAGTTHPSIYLTAIDIARYNRDFAEEDDLCDRLSQLPGVDDSALAMVVDRFLKADQPTRAEEILARALQTHPTSQKLIKRMGDLCAATGRAAEATQYYDRAARMGTRTQEGREADKLLNEQAAVLTDRERGSLALAWREAAGFGVLFLLLAWQDAGLNLLSLGLTRWLGVVVGVLGGYLAVTATSSPQQQPLAAWLGGTVPPPRENQRKIIYDEQSPAGLVEEPTSLPIIPLTWRLLLGLLGLALLALAVWLAFNSAITLLIEPVTPPDLPSVLDFLE
jgi:tetratricopeptide (TPR) repeat protein